MLMPTTPGIIETDNLNLKQRIRQQEPERVQNYFIFGHKITWSEIRPAWIYEGKQEYLVGIVTISLA